MPPTDNTPSADQQPPPRALRVAVFGHYGNLNLGDEAIITAVISGIRAHEPDALIDCYSVRPRDTADRYGLKAYPIIASARPEPADESSADPGSPRPPAVSAPADPAPSPQPPAQAGGLKAAIKAIPGLSTGAALARAALAFPGKAQTEWRFCREAYAQFKGTDVLMVSGSNQFLDNFGGPWGFPFTVLKWTLLARIAGARVVFASVGAGPIYKALSFFFIRRALPLSHYRSYRDEASRALVEGDKPGAKVVPDLASALDVSDIDIARQPAAGAKPTVGINPMAVYDPRYWYIKDQARYLRYLSQLAGFASRLLREGYPVFFFPTQSKDENVIDDLVEMLDNDVKSGVDPAAIARKADSVGGLMHIIAAADIVVPIRFHGTVLALLAERPTLGVCYYRKAADLLADMGQGRYAIELDKVDTETLWSRFQELERNYADSRAQIAARSAEYRAEVNSQLELILDLARSRKT